MITVETQKNYMNPVYEIISHHDSINGKELH